MIWNWKKRIIFQDEEKLQIECVRWFERAHSEYSFLLHHSPNEGKRGWFERIKLAKMGMRKGFPDLVLFLPRHGFSGLAIELKTASGRLSEHQTKMLHYLRRFGCFRCSEVRSLIDFIDLVENYIIE